MAAAGIQALTGAVAGRLHLSQREGETEPGVDVWDRNAYTYRCVQQGRTSQSLQNNSTNLGPSIQIYGPLGSILIQTTTQVSKYRFKSDDLFTFDKWVRMESQITASTPKFWFCFLIPKLYCNCISIYHSCNWKRICVWILWITFTFLKNKVALFKKMIIFFMIHWLFLHIS